MTHRSFYGRGDHRFEERAEVFRRLKPAVRRSLLQAQAPDDAGHGTLIPRTWRSEFSSVDGCGGNPAGGYTWVGNTSGCFLFKPVGMQAGAGHHAGTTTGWHTVDTRPLVAAPRSGICIFSSSTPSAFGLPAGLEAAPGGDTPPSVGKCAGKLLPRKALTVIIQGRRSCQFNAVG